MHSIDINSIYNLIVEKLRNSNHSEVILELEKSNAGAATGSEALLMQASYLLSLKKLQPLIFKIIEDEIKNYIKFCEKNGLFPK